MTNASATTYFVDLSTSAGGQPNSATNPTTTISSSNTTSNISGAASVTAIASGTGIHNFGVSVDVNISTSQSFAQSGAQFNDGFGYPGSASVTIGDTYTLHIPGASSATINNFSGFFHISGYFDDPNPPMAWTTPSSASYSFSIGDSSSLNPSVGLLSTFSYSHSFVEPETSYGVPVTSYCMPLGCNGSAGYQSFNIIGYFNVQVEGADPTIPILESLSLTDGQGYANFVDPVTLQIDLASLPAGTTVTTASGLPASSGVGAVPELPSWAMMCVGFAGLGLAGYRASRKRAASSAC